MKSYVKGKPPSGQQRAVSARVGMGTRHIRKGDGRSLSPKLVKEIQDEYADGLDIYVLSDVFKIRVDDIRRVVAGKYKEK